MTDTALRLAFAMDENNSHPGLDSLSPAGALTREVWLGRQAPPPPGVEPPTRKLVVCDLPGDAQAGFGEDPGLWTWFGDQISAAGPQRTPAGAGALLVNLMAVDAAYDEEFNAWYDTEHVVRLLDFNKGLLAARRFRSRNDGEKLRYLALYHLADASVPGQPTWREAAATPWTSRIQSVRKGNLRFMFNQRVS